jgi:peptide/nickel transport system permease protein
MAIQIVRRILIAIPLMLALVAVVFVMLRTVVPGDPAAILAGENAPPELIERVRHEQGLDKPLHEQFVIFLGNLLHGDLGRSSTTRQPVIERLVVAFPVTLRLTASTFVFSMTMGLLLGVVTAYWHDTWLDNLLRLVAIFGASMPTFWLGLMLILLFAVTLGVLPVQGDISPRGLILPTLTLGTGAAAELSRFVRSAMLEILSSDYIRTARAKGLDERMVMLHHALRNALIPIITVAAAQIGGLLGGAVITESIFGLPGIGTLSISAIHNRDYALIQGNVLFVCAIYLCINLVADITYAFIDPRIRIQ